MSMGHGLELGRRAPRRIGRRLMSVVTSGALALAVIGQPTPALAQQKELSDRSVGLLMEYAFSILPSPSYTDTRTGKTIPVDKTKPELFKIPLDTARDVVRAGRLSAFAQMCELADEQVENFNALMRIQSTKQKWTDQQLLYIQWLHLFTVMFMTGGVKVEQDEGGGQKRIIELDQKKDGKKAESCSDAERASVRNQILAYKATVQRRRQPQPRPRSKRSNRYSRTAIGEGSQALRPFSASGSATQVKLALNQ
jgi:hypothetical protein